jgi:hypothetical protein
MPSSENPFSTAINLPTGIEFNVEYHVLANKAFRYLLTRVSEEKELSAGERYIGEFLSHYLTAWKTRMPEGDPGLAIAIRGGLFLLDSIRKHEEIAEVHLSLTDALMPFVRRWGRELKTLSPEQQRSTMDPSTTEQP